jgi:hypothetical protein
VSIVTLAEVLDAPLLIVTKESSAPTFWRRRTVEVFGSVIKE